MTETMRAVVMTGYGGTDVLEMREVAPPPFRIDNDVLVDVHAAGVNPFETKLRRGWLAQLFPLTFPHVLGSDVAGVVAHAGFDVTELAVGDRVWGMIDSLRWGAYAERVAVTSYLLRRAPSNLSFEQAAAVPMAGCTAWHGLVNLGGIGPGSRVLVQAGAGGVGSLAVQIAKQRGAWVAATCSSGNLDYVKGLGADLVIDYTAGDFRDAVSDIDVVLDSQGGDVALRSYDVLKRGGQLLIVLRGDQVELKARAEMTAKYGVTTREVAFSAQPEILDRLCELFESGALKPPHVEVLPLERAAEAHARIETGRIRGKLVLKVR
jgi:NADPH:quinone reductase-like Zn-dependent oxidoreductase